MLFYLQLAMIMMTMVAITIKSKGWERPNIGIKYAQILFNLLKAASMNLQLIW